MSNQPEILEIENIIDKDSKGNITVIATKEIVDRDGDKILVSGLTTKNFKANPVMLFSHQRDIPAIGLWKNVKKTNIDGVPAITMQPEFTKSENHKLARIVNDLVDEGIMKSVSISIRPNWEKIEYKDAKGKTKAHRIINEGDVHEVSWVNVGGNEQAMRKALSDDDYNYITKMGEVEEESVEALDLEKIITEKDNRIAELELLVKESEVEDEIEDDIYTQLWNEFMAPAEENPSANGDQIEDELSVDDLDELL